MKLIKSKRYFGLFLLGLVLVFMLSIRVSVHAATQPFTYPKSIMTEYSKNSRNWLLIPVNVADEKLWDNSNPYGSNNYENFWNITSSNTKVATRTKKLEFTQLASTIKYGPRILLKGTGTTTITFKVKIGRKTYSCSTKVTVLANSGNPIKSFSADGKAVTSGYHTYNNATSYYNDTASYNKKKSSHTIKVQLKSGWTLKSIEGSTWSNRKNDFVTVKLKSGVAFSKKYENILVTAQNTKTKMIKTVEYTLYD